MTTMHPTLHHLTLTTLILTFTTLQSPTSSTYFTFNSFTPSSNLLFFGNSSLHKSPNLISLTNDSPFTIGRVLYPTRVPTKSPQKPHQTLPFSTSFIFSIAQVTNFLPGHGFVFIFVPSIGINGTGSAQHLGLFNRTNDGSFENHVFGVEFDVFRNPEFNDVNDNHIGVNLNSLTSFASHPSGYWRFDEKSDGYFEDLKLNNGVNYQVWIDYWDSMLSVSIAPAGMKRPSKALIKVSVDLSSVFFDEMYVGFCGATGKLVESHRILAWSFSNTNRLVGDLLITSNLPNFVPRGGTSSVFRSKGVIAGVTLAVVFVLCCGVGVLVLVFKKRRRRRRSRKRDVEDFEEWELEYWPHRIVYQSIFEGTNGFAEENVIGFGGNGKVYKGVEGGVEIAVKRFLHKSEEGMKEFLAEVSSLGRLKHRNLVGLRGWCKRDKDSLILVYDYLENGSLDKRVFECEGNSMLNWEDRIRILKDVANGVLYLHEGWEKRVLHRDIKASNVLLDSEMNGRLGDFGLARMYGHGEGSSTTRVVGTVGYMAPELVRTGRASEQTDVFGFGVLILEVVCGRRPIEDGKPPLGEWLWALMEQDKLVSAVDERLKAKGGYGDEEVERILHLGLLCAYPEPNNRPTMRQVVKLLEGQSNVAEGIEGEGFDMRLLDKVKSTTMWSKYHHSSSSGGHPTFNELRQSMSSSMSLSWSDVMVDGR
ncbi:hypothetical protein Syun_027470 [Stephania yunnanensis]|uniref:non-specific serine/threonine protein kinase n=1 Tax=Stephania yunnanensis TaxID=152371 RepID=A0AAP0EPI3_9MAGN